MSSLSDSRPSDNSVDFVSGLEIQAVGRRLQVGIIDRSEALSRILVIMEEAARSEQ